MAGRIKGITVEIGGDTTGLDKALKGVNTTIRTTQASLKDVNKLLKLDPKNTTLLSQKQKLLKDSISATREKLEGLKQAQIQAKEQLERGELGQDKYDALQREIIETENELKRLEKEAGTCESRLAKMAAVGEKMQKAGDGISGVGKKLLPVSGAIAGLGAATVKTAADFDTAMSKVAAVSGATGEDFDKLREKAREMGSKTKFSASEAAEAMNYMAMAGWKTEDMLSGIDGIMNLAAASGEDLAATSDIVTDALTAFGLSASDSGHFADVLAAAASNANTNVGMLGESFKYAAPVAGALGATSEDTTLALGLMANAGIKASQSGTALRTGLSNLAKPTKQMQDYMDQYNISLQKNEDGSVNLRATMEHLKERLGGLSQSEQAAAASAIFGKNAMSGWLAIINSSDKDFSKLEGAIDHADGASEKMAQTMQDNLMGQITILKPQLQELAISFGDMLMPMIRKVVTAIQGFVDQLNVMDKSQRNAILRIALIVAALGPFLVILGTTISKAGLAMTAFSKLGIMAGKASAAIKAAGGMGAFFGKAIGALMSPVTAVVAVIAVLVAAFVHLWKTNESFRNSMIAIWNQIRDSVTSFVNEVKSRFADLGINFSSVTSVLKKIWEGLCQILAPVFEGAFQVIATVLKTVLDSLIGILDIFIGLFTGDWDKVWQGVEEIFTAVWTGLQGILKTKLDTMKKISDVVLKWFGTSWKKIWTSIKSVVSGIWNAMKKLAKTTFNSLKTAILTPIKGARTSLSSLWSGIRTAAGNAWRGMKSTAGTVWKAIKTAVTTPIKSVKTTLSSLWNGIKSSARSTWTGIKNAMINPIESARDKIRSIVQKIKGFFPLSIGRIFTGLKLPHFSVSGKAPFGLGGKGTAPAIHVSWYARAMEKGMILDSPTIFGAMKGSLLGAGEAGSETVVGTESLMNMITTAVSGVGDEIVKAFLAAGSLQQKDITINVSVNGAENPEDWGKRLVRQMKLEMRTV